MTTQDLPQTPGGDAGTGRLFSRLDWSAFFTALVISFAVYLYTLAPTVTLEDSGELAVAGEALGVPHPPGYPIWTMLAYVFTKIFVFVPFRGQPNPAWAIGLMSAVFGALAAGITAMLICRSGADILNRSKHISYDVDESTRNAVCWVSGVVCSLLFAFSPVMWSQSVIVEVYALNAFFLVLIFLLVYIWIRRPSDPVLYVTAFVFGLGLTNYQVLLLAALALVIAVMLRDMQLFRDFLITGAPFGIVLLLIRRGVLPGISHPSEPSAFLYVSLNFLVLALAYFLLPRGKTVAVSLLLVELGIAFYGYMPIVSDLRNPPMNWAYPRTWEGFLHAITRGQYEKIKPVDVFTRKFLAQIGDYLTDLRGQFTLPVALLGFLPFTAWQARVAGRRLKGTYMAIALAILASLVVVAERVLPATQGALVLVYKLLIVGIVAILVTGATAVLLSQGRELVLRAIGKIRSTVSERTTIGLVLLGATGLFLGYVFMMARKLVEVTAPLRAADATVTGEQIRGIFLDCGGIVLLVAAPLLIAGFLIWLMHSRCEFEVTVDHNSQRWLIATLFGFLAMSIVLIALANPKADIQDTFIQRVKFISSHALYVFWIGYGLVFGLVLVDVLFRTNRLMKWASLSVAAMLPLIPIHQNAYNAELIRKSGGAEQNGHDFGWQFGNYQLRGADAIREELAPDEEPLPNPEFPPEMGPDAVFFGGTDPGRFVPTYMIYGADVRPDVYLITQNALADNTYMSVMRDLYGNLIWIPGQADSAKAFQRYVEEVKSGKRPQNAQLKIEDGRVQVSGALGVMEINGILAEMIFEHNNYKHDFYVEESYVIPWMYRYLTPHGLIMAINPTPTPLKAGIVRNDLDFWDWYTRRLMDDRRFIRDVVARKSFSKLRSAIGGLYADRRSYGQAETAFREARILYPLSPEANFRLVQEVLLPQRRLEDSREIISEFSRQDPGNEKAPDFLEHLDELEDLEDRVQELEQRMNDRKLDVSGAVELAKLYQKAGERAKFANFVNGLLNNTQLPPMVYMELSGLLAKVNDPRAAARALDLCLEALPEDAPPEAYLNIAGMYARLQLSDKMGVPLAKYLEKRPEDWRAWLDMAAIQIGQGRENEAGTSLGNAMKWGGAAARTTIARDPRFKSIRSRASSRARRLIGLPRNGLTPAGPRRSDSR